MLRKLQTRIFFVAVSMFFVRPAAAGLKADLEVKSLQQSQDSASQSGAMKVYMEGDSFRSDMNQGGAKMSQIIRRKDKKAFMLVHDAKQYMEINLDDLEKSNPGSVLEGKDFEKNLRAQGWDVKKIGQEKIENHVCDIYEMESRKDGQIVKLKTWLANDFADIGMPVALKTISSFEGKPMAEMTMKNLEKSRIAASLFEIPKGYTRAETPKMDAARQKELEKMRNSQGKQ